MSTRKIRICSSEDNLYYHADEEGEAIYPNLYRAISSYSDGFAIAHCLDGGDLKSAAYDHEPVGVIAIHGQ